MHLLLWTGLIGSGLTVLVLHIRLHQIGNELEEYQNERLNAMTWLYVLAAVVAIFLFAYLLVALFYAEKF